MSLKCSLFGHAFGEAAVDREREEQGSEVVITIREVETCERCGAQRVVSQNKEVRTLEGADTGEGAPAQGTGAEAGTESDGWSSPGTDLSGGGGGGDAVIDDDARDAEFLGEGEDEEAEAAPEATADEGAVADAESDEGQATIPEATDRDDGTAVIEDDSDESLGGADAVAEVEEAGLSDPDEEDDGPSGADDDAVILDDEDGPDEREPGQWPEDHEADEPDWVRESEPGPDTADRRAAGGADPDEASADPDAAKADAPSDETGDGTDQEVEPEPTTGAVTVPDGEFVCEDCGFRTDVADSSLRAGDFCPECHSGTLEHREP